MSHYFLNERYYSGRTCRGLCENALRPTRCATTLRILIVHSCHDLPASGGHLTFKTAFDKIRDRYWWRTISKDVAEHMKGCSSCQHCKTSHSFPKLPVGDRPVSRPFQCMAIDLVENKSSSNHSKYVMSVTDHLPRFLVLVAISDKSAAAIARVLVERVFSVLSAPETPHSDMGAELGLKRRAH